jgi:hypothetical protein
VSSRGLVVKTEDSWLMTIHGIEWIVSLSADWDQKSNNKKKKTFKTFGKTFFKSIWKKMLIRFCLLSFLSLKFDKVTTINRIIWKKESFANTPPGKNFDKRLFCKQSGVFENLYVFYYYLFEKHNFIALLSFQAYVLKCSCLAVLKFELSQQKIWLK